MISCKQRIALVFGNRVSIDIAQCALLLFAVDRGQHLLMQFNLIFMIIASEYAIILPFLWESLLQMDLLKFKIYKKLMHYQEIRATAHPFLIFRFWFLIPSNIAGWIKLVKIPTWFPIERHWTLTARQWMPLSMLFLVVAAMLAAWSLCLNLFILEII